MKTLIGCMITGYILLQFSHALDRLSTDALGMAIGLGFGVLAGIPAALMMLVSAQRRQPEPPARYQPPVTLPRFEVVEGRDGRLYSYDSQTGAMILIDDRKRIEVKR